MIASRRIKTKQTVEMAKATKKKAVKKPPPPPPPPKADSARKRVMAAVRKMKRLEEAHAKMEKMRALAAL